MAEHGEYLGEFRVDLPDEAPRWLSSRGRAESSAAVPGGRLLGAVIDITERKHAEDAARGLSQQLILAQEQERARIARELHDDMSQRLARLAIDAARVEQEVSDAASVETVRGIHRELVRLSEDVHTLSYRLHPSVLKDLGLVDALRIECEGFSTGSSASADLRLQALPEAIARDPALCLFRVAQEALRNIMRHASASDVKVLLSGMADGLQLVVQDDGVGFDSAPRTRRPTLGLASMRERVALLGGELDVESALGLGTTVLAWVPLNEVPS